MPNGQPTEQDIRSRAQQVIGAFQAGEIDETQLNTVLGKARQMIEGLGPSAPTEPASVEPVPTGGGTFGATIGPVVDGTVPAGDVAREESLKFLGEEAIARPGGVNDNAFSRFIWDNAPTSVKSEIVDLMRQAEPEAGGAPIGRFVDQVVGDVSRGVVRGLLPGVAEQIGAVSPELRIEARQVGDEETLERLAKGDPISPGRRNPIVAGVGRALEKFTAFKHGPTLDELKQLDTLPADSAEAKAIRAKITATKQSAKRIAEGLVPSRIGGAEQEASAGQFVAESIIGEAAFRILASQRLRSAEGFLGQIGQKPGAALPPGATRRQRILFQEEQLRRTGRLALPKGTIPIIPPPPPAKQLVFNFHVDVPVAVQDDFFRLLRRAQKTGSGIRIGVDKTARGFQGTVNAGATSMRTAPRATLEEAKADMARLLDMYRDSTKVLDPILSPPGVRKPTVSPGGTQLTAAVEDVVPSEPTPDDLANLFERGARPEVPPVVSLEGVIPGQEALSPKIRITQPVDSVQYLSLIEDTSPVVRDIPLQEQLTLLDDIPFQSEPQVENTLRLVMGGGRQQRLVALDDVAGIKALDQEQLLSSMRSGIPPNVLGGRAGMIERISLSEDPRMVGWFEEFLRKEVDPGLVRAVGPEGNEILSLTKRSERDTGLALGRIWAGGDVTSPGLQTPLSRLSKKEGLNLADVLDGIAQPTNKKVRDAMVVARGWLDNTVQEAIDTGVQTTLRDGSRRTVGRLRSFFPHHVKSKFFTGRRNRRSLISAIANANDISFAEASRIVNQLRNLRRVGKSGSLNFERQLNIPVEFLERDARKVLPRYFAQAHTEIGEARWFGPTGERIRELSNSVRARGGDVQLFDKLVKRLTQPEDFDFGAKKVSRFVRGTAVVTSMYRSAFSSMATITNWPAIAKGQGFSGMVMDSLGGVLDGWSKAFVGQAARAGVIENDILRFASEVGDLDVAREFLRIVQQRRFELGVRRGTVGMAQRHANRLATTLNKAQRAGKVENPYAKSVLIELLNDVDNSALAALETNEVIRSGKLSTQQLNRIGRSAVARTQPLSVTDVPFNLAGPLGRVRGQFRITLLKEFRFFANSVGKDAQQFVATRGKEGSMKPLIAWLVGGQIVGESISDLKAMVAGAIKQGDPGAALDARSEKLMVRMFDNMLQVGGVAYVMDYYSSIRRDPRNGAMASVVGPGVQKLSSVVGSAITGNGEQIVEQLTPLDVGTPRRIGRSQAEVILGEQPRRGRARRARRNRARR